MSSTINGSSLMRVTGLASNMDTDSIVKKMMAGTQSKIDTANQQKTLLEWKQEDYRTIIGKLKSFQDKYLGSSSTGSLASSFYTSKTVSFLNSEASKYVGITASPSTNISNINVSNIKTATRSTAVSSGSVCSQIEIGFDASSAPIDLTGKSFELTLDGVTKAISFSKAYNTAAELSADIKQLADAAFGSDRLSATVSGSKIIINTDGTKASIAGPSTNNALTSAGITLISDETERLDLTKSAAENLFKTPVTGDPLKFTINGKDFEFAGNTSIGTIINSINASAAGVKISYSSVSDKFTMTSSNTGSGSSIDFEDVSGNFMTSIIGTLDGTNYTQGADASLYIDGTKVTRSQNVFTIDGVTYNLKADSTETFKATIDTDLDNAVKNIKAFVDDYNDLLKTLNSEVNETRYKKFAPLTDEQKSELKDSEVTKWEEKARSGMLKNDTAIRKVITELRNSIYTPVKTLADNSENLSISMATIGISTTNYKSQGQLVVDETKLRTALEAHPDEVVSLFTQKSDKIYLPTNTEEVRTERYNESGIMYRLSDILNDSVRTTLGGGTLIQLAGYDGTATDNQNEISKSIKRYDNKLDDLLDDFSREETRYYNQFAAMEKYISQMNQTSNWLSNSLN